MRKCLSLLSCALALLFQAGTLLAQAPTPAPADGAAAPSASETASSGPGSYRGFSLGMDLEALKGALAADELLRFRGDPDVSLLPNRDQTLIETTGYSFIRRAFFQLRDGKLFIMAFSLDTKLVDHYSVFTTLTEKYGDPETLDPKEAVWKVGGVRLSLERPLTVKYIDLAAFEKLLGEASTAEAREEVLRKEFLNGF